MIYINMSQTLWNVYTRKYIRMYVRFCLHIYWECIGIDFLHPADLGLEFTHFAESGSFIFSIGFWVFCLDASVYFLLVFWKSHGIFAFRSWKSHGILTQTFPRNRYLLSETWTQTHMLLVLLPWLPMRIHHYAHEHALDKKYFEIRMPPLHVHCNYSEFEWVSVWHKKSF